MSEDIGPDYFRLWVPNCYTDTGPGDYNQMSRPVMMTDAQRQLAHHLTRCPVCLLVATKQRQSLAGGGCAEFQALSASAYPEGISADSPLRSVHITEDMIEDFHFRRMNDLETRLMQTHVKTCDACSIKLHNELLFIYSLKAALKPQEFTPNQNRDGATFASAAAAA